MNSNEGLPGLHYYPAVAKTARVPNSRTARCETGALYVHIPFCDKRCYFCEFAVVTGKSVTDSLVVEYLKALKEEMLSFLATSEYQPAIELIQFGGGTPTALSAEALSDLLGFIYDRFDCSKLKEIIIEAFPNSITDDRIAFLERVPNLKLNIGVQSFHAECVASVGREHGAKAEEAITRAVASNIRSIGVDLIFGLPFSSPATVRSDIEKACALGVEHCALYPLWIYDQTPLELQLRSGKVLLPSSDMQREQLVGAFEALTSHKFSPYTVFHYSLTESARHCYGLWQMHARNWVGFGMSAMSHIDGNIFFNERNIGSYVQRIKLHGSAVVDSCCLSRAEQMSFVFLYGLRLGNYPTSLFSDRFGVTIEETFDNKLMNLEARGLLTHTEGRIALTLPGVLALSAIEDYINGKSDAVKGPLVLA